jgi:hypothetical protein
MLLTLRTLYNAIARTSQACTGLIQHKQKRGQDVKKGKKTVA